jgi:hypothetical protein
MGSPASDNLRLLPLAITILLALEVLRVVFDVACDATSHNLWPFEILMYGAVQYRVEAVLWVARKLSGAGRRE